MQGYQLSTVRYSYINPRGGLTGQKQLGAVHRVSCENWEMLLNILFRSNFLSVCYDAFTKTDILSAPPAVTDFLRLYKPHKQSICSSPVFNQTSPSMYGRELLTRSASLSNLSLLLRFSYYHRSKYLHVFQSICQEQDTCNDRKRHDSSMTTDNPGTHRRCLHTRFSSETLSLTFLRYLETAHHGRPSKEHVYCLQSA